MDFLALVFFIDSFYNKEQTKAWDNMKILKACGCMGASVLICAGILVYSAVKSCERIAVDSIVNEVVDQVAQKALESSSQFFEQALPEDVQQQITQGVMDHLPAETQEKIDEVKDEIANDEKINALSKKYMDALLAGAIDGTSELPDVNADVKQVLEDSLPEVAKITGKELPSEEIANLTDELLAKTNLQERLESTVQQVHASMSPSQKQLLSMVRSFQNGSMLWAAYGMIAFGLLAIILLTLHPLKWMLYGGISSLLSGGCLLAGGKLMQLLLGNKFAALGSVFETISASLFASLFASGILFMGIGIGALLLYALFTFVKNHLVYE